MLNRRNIIALCCILSMLLVYGALSAPRNAHGQMTIPTRTPRPADGGGDGGGDNGGGGGDNGGGGGDNGDGGGDNGGGGDNNAQPTNEPAPTTDPGAGAPAQATAVPTLLSPTETPFSTATAIPTLATATPFVIVPGDASATPAASATAEPIIGEVVVVFPAENVAYPQAGPCDLPPTFTSLDAISIYAGPGEDYMLVGLLGETEVRPIVGRAAFTNWWVIQLDRTGRIGWASDKSGTIHGYTGRVPIITAPDLDGVAPTPGGPAWVPTPEVECSIPELAAAAAAINATTEDGEAFSPPSNKPESPEGVVEINGAVDAKRPVQGSDSGESSAAVQTAGDSNDAAPGVVQIGEETAADPLLNDLADAAAPLELTGSTSAAPQLPNLMPIAGIVLIVAAVIVGMIARRGGSNGVPE